MQYSLHKNSNNIYHTSRKNVKTYMKVQNIPNSQSNP